MQWLVATCSDCYVSNAATADIEIIEDTLFDLGTIIGKVFYDANEDGWQDAGEAGIAAAMVALDDGTYALTDQFGRYHFPAVKPGQRLVKINLNSLAGRAVTTNDKTQILNVTPGLLAKANFGVMLDTVDAAIGADGQRGVMVDSAATEPPILINGSTVAMSLLVNGQPAALATADVKLSTRQLDDVVELESGKLASPIRFTTDANKQIETWELLVSSSRGEVIYSRSGERQVPAVIEWDGIRDNGKLISGGDVYTYQMTLKTNAGETLTSNRRIFGVNRRNTVSLNLAGGAFVTGSHELTSKAKVLLKQTAKAIRSYPDEVIFIAGHTDSVGTAENNKALSERRARSAFNYLTTTEQIPEDRFMVQAYGESRPVADNDTAWGREMNRRVEINGDLRKVDVAKNYDPYRQPPLVRIDGREVPVDDNGRFVAELDSADAEDSMQVLLATAQGRSIETTIPLPTIKVLAPTDTFAIAYEEQQAGQRLADSTMPRDAVLTTSLVAQTEPGNTVELDGEALEVDENGRFESVIKVKAGENYYGLVARNPMGMLRIANLRLSVTDTIDGKPAMAIEPIPQLALQLPPRGVPMTNSSLVVPGRTAPGNRVYINDTEVAVDETGNFVVTMKLARGDNPFTARVVDSNGYSGQIEQTFNYAGDKMFFMALLDGKFSQIETSGSLEAAGTDKRSETVSEGRIAYYLKGHVLGKYLLTSAFDSGQQKLGDLFADITARDNERLLTNLDPDTLYPVYGDDSTLVYDAQSQSKFYVALEGDKGQCHDRQLRAELHRHGTRRLSTHAVWRVRHVSVTGR